MSNTSEGIDSTGGAGPSESRAEEDTSRSGRRRDRVELPVRAVLAAAKDKLRSLHKRSKHEKSSQIPGSFESNELQSTPSEEKELDSTGDCSTV